MDPTVNGIQAVDVVFKVNLNLATRICLSGDVIKEDILTALVLRRGEQVGFTR